MTRIWNPLNAYIGFRAKMLGKGILRASCTLASDKFRFSLMQARKVAGACGSENLQFQESWLEQTASNQLAINWLAPFISHFGIPIVDWYTRMARTGFQNSA